MSQQTLDRTRLALESVQSVRIHTRNLLDLWTVASDLSENEVKSLGVQQIKQIHSSLRDLRHLVNSLAYTPTRPRGNRPAILLSPSDPKELPLDAVSQFKELHRKCTLASCLLRESIPRYFKHLKEYSTKATEDEVEDSMDLDSLTDSSVSENS